MCNYYCRSARHVIDIDLGTTNSPECQPVGWYRVWESDCETGPCYGVTYLTPKVPYSSYPTQDPGSIRSDPPLELKPCKVGDENQFNILSLKPWNFKLSKMAQIYSINVQWRQRDTKYKNLKTDSSKSRALDGWFVIWCFSTHNIQGVCVSRQIMKWSAHVEIRKHEIRIMTLEAYMRILEETRYGKP